MPLIRFDILEGRSEAQIAALLDATHRAVVEAFEVPERDRYQVVTEHKPGRFVALDTGLNIERSANVTLISVVSRPRPEQAKQRFYQAVCRELREACGIEPSDVIVSIAINSDADWSFGHGRAQFLSGEL
ncbi:tautomerase family protein [Trinickia soli]|uniref:tautomerase family protein n=1 Tax=Trinickia soli TaxID=380675 RepID=UPI003FA397F9